MWAIDWVACTQETRGLPLAGRCGPLIGGGLHSENTRSTFSWEMWAIDWVACTQETWGLPLAGRCGPLIGGGLHSENTRSTFSWEIWPIDWVACTQKTWGLPLAGRCGPLIGGSKQTPGNFKRSTLCRGNHHKCNSSYCDLEELRAGLPKEVTIVCTTAKALKGIRKHWTFQWQLCFDSCRHFRNFVFTHNGWFYHRHWQKYVHANQISYTCTFGCALSCAEQVLATFWAPGNEAESTPVLVRNYVPRLALSPDLPGLKSNRCMVLQNMPLSTLTVV